MISYHFFIVKPKMMEVCIKNMELLQAGENYLFPCP